MNLAQVYHSPDTGLWWVVIAACMGFVYWWAYMIQKAEDEGNFDRADYMKLGCAAPFILYALGVLIYG